MTWRSSGCDPGQKQEDIHHRDTEDTEPRGRQRRERDLNSPLSSVFLSALCPPCLCGEYCLLFQRQRRNATKSAFSSFVSFSPCTRLKNSTVSSSVRHRPSCRY